MPRTVSAGPTRLTRAGIAAFLDALT